MRPLRQLVEAPVAPGFQTRVGIVRDDPSHRLHSYYNPHIVDGLERVFRCQCRRAPKRTREERDVAQVVLDTFFSDPCPAVSDNYFIEGTIGRGTFGTILVARDRYPDDPTEPTRHYAIKVQSYKHANDEDTTDIAYMEPWRARETWPPVTHREAFILSFLSESKQTTHVYAAGIHHKYAWIVMDIFGADLSGDPEFYIPRASSVPDGLNEIAANVEPDYISYNGEHCVEGSTPRLDEVQVCKVATHLLEALMFIDERGLVHTDMSPRNFLVDFHLNAQLIDFADVTLCTEAAHYQAQILSTLYLLESMVSPEFVAVMNTKAYKSRKWQKNYHHNYDRVDLSDVDIRNDQLWRFACMLFELLHGYPPFANVQRNESGYPVNFRPANVQDMPSRHNDPSIDQLTAMRKGLLVEQRDRRYRDQRRHRIVNGPLQFREAIIVENGEVFDESDGGQSVSWHTQSLTQDCIDVLQAMFIKSRHDRATLEEMASFPWFQGKFLERDDYNFIRPPPANLPWSREQPADVGAARSTDSPPTREMRRVDKELEWKLQGHERRRKRTTRRDKGPPSSPLRSRSGSGPTVSPLTPS